MASTTVTGRVRATVRLKDDGAGVGDRVVESSWASDRAFPRTHGTGVAFELETADGEIFRVDPFEALVTLPVRRSESRDGVRREQSWIAPADEITVEGELERAGRGRQPAGLRARRIVVDGEATRHRLPPRSLQRGALEKIEAVTPAAPPAAAPVAAAATTAPEPRADAAPVATEPSADQASAAAEPSEPTAARRPKKKRPDSSGTPTPVQ